ncbi:MAG: DUF4169 family protein [Hyphomicrobium sp.]
MVAEIVNLNKARKQRARVDRDRSAEENRRRFGQPKAERVKVESEHEHRERLLDGAQRAAPGRLDRDHDDLDPGSVS